MFTINQTATFNNWLLCLKDRQARARILMRIDRMGRGLLGDVKPVGEGVYELRIDYGAGYRVYYKQSGQVIYLLLCGGDKSTQKRDIEQAHKMNLEL
jgi:putative addiction module killer protein